MPQVPKLNRELAENLARLRQIPEWSHFADLAIGLTNKWESMLPKFNIDDSIEKIAKDRIRWTCMVAGVQAVFREMDGMIHALKTLEEGDDHE